MAVVPRLLAIATAVPPYPLDQTDVIERVKLLFGRSPDLDRLLPVFLNTGIHRRYSCVPIEWYERPHGWSERNRIYLDSALDLLEAATKRLLCLTGRHKGEIDSIVVASTTGIATPSLDARLIERMGLRSTVRRLPIFGLGCAGGVIGLARAASQAAVTPGETVLFLVVELCALSFRRRFVEEQYRGNGSVRRRRRCGTAVNRWEGPGPGRLGRTYLAQEPRRDGLGNHR